MDAKTWKLLRRVAARVPLAMVATQSNGIAENPASHAEQEAGTSTFHHEHMLGTSLEMKVRAASFAQAQQAEAAADGVEKICGCS